MTTQRQRQNPNFPPGQVQQPDFGVQQQFYGATPPQSRSGGWNIGIAIALATLIFTGIIQTGTGIWYASKLSSDVENGKRIMSDTQSEVKEHEKILGDLIAKLSSIDQGVHDMKEYLIQRPQYVPVPTASVINTQPAQQGQLPH